MTQNRIHYSSNKFNIKTRLSELDISERLFNICKKAGINSLEDLFKLDYDTLISLKGLGKKTLEEINSLRIRYGYESLYYSYNIDQSKIIAQRNNVKYSLEQLNSINYDRLINIDVSELNLTNRLINVLNRFGIKKIKDIIELDILPSKLYLQKGVGLKTVKEYEFFYCILKKKIPKNQKSLSKRFREIDLLLNKKLNELTISFPLYKALRQLGVYKLKDILDLQITPKKLYTQIGLRGESIKEFNSLFEKLKREKNQFELNFPELFKEDENFFEISYFPKKFLNIPINFFILPPVIDSFLEKNKIRTFKELGSNPKNKFIGLTPFIESTINSLVQNIINGNFYEYFLPREPYYFPIWVDNFIKNLNDRDSEILKLRFACYGKRYTLEKISRKFGITRERTRQIIAQLKVSFRKKFNPELYKLEKLFKETIITQKMQQT